MKKPIKVNGENIFEYEEKFKQLIARNPFADISDINLEDLDSKIQEINIFEIMNTPDDIKKVSKNRWTSYGTGYKIGLGKQTRELTIAGTSYTKEVEVATAIVIQENALGNYTIDVLEMTEQTPHFKNGFSRWAKKVVHSEEAPMKEVALMRADKLIAERFADRTALVSQDARWLSTKPTPKQIELLKKFGFKDVENVTK